MSCRAVMLIVKFSNLEVESSCVVEADWVVVVVVE
jgi:hypothetical protein